MTTAPPNRRRRSFFLMPVLAALMLSAPAWATVALLAGERRRALHVDRDHRPVAGNVVGEDPQQRGGLAGTARAQDQAVSRQLLV